MTNNELLKMAERALKDLVWAASERDKRNRIRQFDEFMDQANAAIAALSSPIDKGETKPHFDHLAGGKPEQPPIATDRLATVQLWMCDQSTGQEGYVRSGPRWQIEEMRDTANAAGGDYFIRGAAAQSGREAPTTEGNK